MSKFLRDLLDAKEPMFSLALRQLEKASGNPSADARLVGELIEKSHRAIRGLGLDPKDSTGPEIFRAQMNRIEADALRVTKLIGGNDPSDVAGLSPLMVKAAESTKINKDCWVLKHSVAKKFLQQMPPEKLMAKLGYRSVDSMLKHEDIDEIYTALRFSEGAEWLNKYNELFKTVTPSDFETRKIRIIVMDHDKYVDLASKFVAKKLHNITHTKEMGTIVVVPMKAKTMKGIVLKSMPLLFHYINEIRLYSAFFKLQQVKANFGDIVVNTLIADPGNAANMAGQQVHWRVIQRYFGRPSPGVHEEFPEAFQPHVHPEDLHWRNANDMLYELDPEMEFWKDLDYVAMMYDGEPLTFNLLDVSFAYTNSEPYEQRYYYHFRESLWNEIFIRYMGQKNLEQQILRQLDNDMIVPRSLTPPKQTVKQETALKRIKSDTLIRKKLIAAAEGRLIGVTKEFEEAFDVLEQHDKTVTVFGSARLTSDSPAYAWAHSLGRVLAGAGFTVVTGGGHGIMEAANKGAFETGGGSLGFNINLPTEQKLNEYVTENYQFEHFFGRKVALTLDARAYVFFPGGFGTLDELFEILTLEQTGKIPRVPVILFGKDFWQPFAEFVANFLDKKFATISSSDKKIFTITDDVDEALQIIKTHEEDYRKQPEGSKPHPKKK